MNRLRIKNGMGNDDMSESSEIVFMQGRLLRLASEEWHMSIQMANTVFDKYSILKFIEDC